MTVRRTAGRRLRSNGPHLISSELFRDALVRERRRADRFEARFVLMLISFDRRGGSPSRPAHLAEALSQATIDADLVGWYEQGTVIGVLRSLDGNAAEATETTTTLADAIQRDLLRHLPPDDAAACAMRLEVYPPQDHTAPCAFVEEPMPRRTLRHVARTSAKRGLDLAGSAACLALLSPVFLCVAALVKCSSKGPVLFRQERVGLAGRPFPMLKFRTMQVNADPSLHRQYVESFIQNREQPTEGATPLFKIVNDPRVTSIGHFLRRSSLDELPQLWNVLRGEMSLVGPRPPLPYEVARYKRWHYRRVLDAKPGITGLWQVTGRSRTTFDEMVRLDVRYAATSSVWVDLKILLATPRAVLTGKGAH